MRQEASAERTVPTYMGRIGRPEETRLVQKKDCSSCKRSLQVESFPSIKGKRQAKCGVCLNAERRLREKLPPLRRDCREVIINNAMGLWFGPVNLGQLRSRA